MDFFQSAVKTLSVEISENFFSPISSNFSTSIQCKNFFKQVGPKTKKNNTKAGITQDCNEQRPKFFHQELVQIEGLPKKGC